jgi:hypothetical protein
MSLLDRIKQMVRGHSGATEEVIRKAGSTREILDHLDELITTNEVELRKTRNELARLEMSERASIENVKSGRIGDREKEFVLLQIKRTRGQMDGLKVKADILNKNIELHMSLVGKIQAMEAMDLRGIEQSMVEKVILDYEEGMEKFKESVHSGEGVTEKKEEVLSSKDKEDLRKLEQEILGEGKPAKEAEKEDVVEKAEAEQKARQKDSESFSDEALAELEAELMQNERERKEAANEFESENNGGQKKKPELE